MCVDKLALVSRLLFDRRVVQQRQEIERLREEALRAFFKTHIRLAHQFLFKPRVPGPPVGVFTFTGNHTGVASEMYPLGSALDGGLLSPSLCGKLVVVASPGLADGHAGLAGAPFFAGATQLSLDEDAHEELALYLADQCGANVAVAAHAFVWQFEAGDDAASVVELHLRLARASDVVAVFGKSELWPIEVFARRDDGALNSCGAVVCVPAEPAS